MMLSYVRDGAYETLEFTDYIDARLLELQMTGP